MPVLLQSSANGLRLPSVYPDAAKSTTAWKHFTHSLECPQDAEAIGCVMETEQMLPQSS